MKTALIATVAAFVLVSVGSVPVMAQQDEHDDYGTSHRGGYQMHDRGDYDRSAGRRDDEDRDQGRDWDRPRHMAFMRWMMLRRGGARFQFSRGDARIDIRCPQNESLQDCVDAAGRLLDKVHTLETGTAPQGATGHQ
jgi:hypothetical protein